MRTKCIHGTLAVGQQVALTAQKPTRSCPQGCLYLCHHERDSGDVAAIQVVHVRVRNTADATDGASRVGRHGSVWRKLPLHYFTLPTQVKGVPAALMDNFPRTQTESSQRKFILLSHSGKFKQVLPSLCCCLHKHLVAAILTRSEVMHYSCVQGYFYLCHHEGDSGDVAAIQVVHVRMRNTADATDGASRVGRHGSVWRKLPLQYSTLPTQVKDVPAALMDNFPRTQTESSQRKFILLSHSGKFKQVLPSLCCCLHKRLVAAILTRSEVMHYSGVQVQVYVLGIRCIVACQ
ncbi:hypothetical protein VOLCADRAFT_99806 [Volvox carteri f. nagariensis]|uniref:Uncharacterized protein n=1 Tax=Volvox carteri f. nagariensis TaxID=3068 RepID=D8UIP7_VOLCA|nr:uncharacterized protein VOLCADRAFT_99806 [Volvox carteri f. nagariensis]EFJ40378.1 hypothetical protein VOLCADRAFT_99806 [Volvox carteri f. nagariensis]|eukprot:XP_002958529.1 hypothetical protein VOLCADRAFT_99806 [Volvox carteri f. nagariensis]